MPFDGAPTEPRTPEIMIIDEVMAILGPNGEHWIKHRLHSTRGGYCLLGAVAKAARVDYKNIDSHFKTITLRDQVLVRLASVLPEFSPGPTTTAMAKMYVVKYNDSFFRRFAAIKKVLVQARKEAVANVQVHGRF